MEKKTKVGVIGLGWVGGAYAEALSRKADIDLVKYDSKKEPYTENKDLIRECTVVFVAVPTPTVDGEFDYSALNNALSIIEKDTLVIIKSSIIPGTTRKLQEKFPDIVIIHVPEFLREKTALEDVINPERNIFGLSTLDPQIIERVKSVHHVFSPAPYENFCLYEEAELVKYAGNSFLYFKVVFANVLFDICQKLDIDYETVKSNLSHDSRIGKSHLDINEGGRGAGGNCFIKDFVAISNFIDEIGLDEKTKAFFKAAEEKNLQLLRSTNKDPDLVRGVYGDVVDN